MRHAAQVESYAGSHVKDLLAWLAAVAERRATFRDLRMAVVRRVFLREQQRYNFYIKKYKFLDQRKGSKNVTVLLLAGAHDYTWRIVFRRLYEYSDDLDVVVVNPGGLNGELCMKFARDYGWSYFECFPNSITAAENFVLKNIIESDKVIKMDDDILITKNTFKNILKAYNAVKEEGIEIGFLAPVLNVNNVSYYFFLKTLGLIEELVHSLRNPISSSARAALRVCSKLYPFSLLISALRGKSATRPRTELRRFA